MIKKIIEIIVKIFKVILFLLYCLAYILVITAFIFAKVEIPYMEENLFIVGFLLLGHLPFVTCGWLLDRILKTENTRAQIILIPIALFLLYIQSMHTFIILLLFDLALQP